jgi:Tfp pilus assembly protein PilF
MTSDPDINSAEAISLANTYADARNYRRAEEVLRSALVHDPHNAGLLTELARAQHLRGDNTAAEKSARNALPSHRTTPMRCGSTRRSSLS